MLKPGGRFAVEIGYDQKDAVEALFREAGAAEVADLRDLGDRDRVVAGAKKPLETASSSRYIRSRLHPNRRLQVEASRRRTHAGPDRRDGFQRPLA